jgi:hypothetical protein
MCPEIINKVEYLPQPADIWAIAVMIMRMSSGVLPFSGKDLEATNIQGRIQNS